MFEIIKTSRESIIKSIEEIAKHLILNKTISVNSYLFSFVDIEVYYWHENHKDNYTMKHNRPIGEFEIHRFGLDLSLGNLNMKDYGGILICGLYDIQEKRLIQKPQVIKELFNQIRMGDNTLNLVDFKSPWRDVFKSKRLHLGELGNDLYKKMFVDSLYKYIAMEKGILVGYKGKEVILKASNLSEGKIHALLNYKLSK
jgi:hypothetical protein